MKPSSAKNKGRLLQKLVVQKLRDTFNLSEHDCKSTPMGTQGEDVWLSTNALELFRYGIECKNRARIAVYTDYEQAIRHCEGKDKEPLLVIKQNRSDPLALVSLNHFIALAEKAKLWEAHQKQKTVEESKQATRMRKVYGKH